MSTHPEVELGEAKITDAWKRFILYCQREVPHGEVRVQIVSGEPTRLLDLKKAIRFDKEDSIPFSFRKE